MIHQLKQLLPASLLSAYHFTLAAWGALLYRFPSRSLKVIAITGTKGKTSTAELVNAVLEEAGHRTALAGTLRFKINHHSERNLKKMTTPGRLFLQRFLRQAVNNDCDIAVLELSSEGAKQYRHRFLELDALIFTNLAPEHIESHGSYEKYREAKLDIARQLKRSSKPEKVLVVNAGDPEHQRFVEAAGETVSAHSFSLQDAEPYELQEEQTNFTFRGQSFRTELLGEFSLLNILAALTLAEAFGIDPARLETAVENYRHLPGRGERIKAGQSFPVVVDYAHTPDSLEQLYRSFTRQDEETITAGQEPPGGASLICVLGNAGGGRDRWKRRTMAEIADRYCRQIILTNEDPYDEDPRAIVGEMEAGISQTPYEVLMDRREAINSACRQARDLAENQASVAVLISGKGTDPYIMEAKGQKTPWDDREVAREELEKIQSDQN